MAEADRREYRGALWLAPLLRPGGFLRYGIALVRGSLTVHANYLFWALRWLRCGGSPRWWLEPARWLVVRRELRSLPAGAHVLELGAGLAGLLLASGGREVTSVDQDVAELEKVRRAAPRLARRMELVHAPIRDVGGGMRGYGLDGVARSGFDAILIDGPSHDIGRRGILLAEGRRLLESASIVLLDDADRPAERRLAEEIAATTGRTCRIDHGVGIVR